MRRKLWMRTSIKCAGIRRKVIEAAMRERERSSRALYNGLRSNWEEEEYVELCTGDAGRRIV
jgi:hypothetical protein